MSVAPRLDLRQSQQLVMTPQLQQAIKMLQMSNIELLDYVAEELERNPLLERADGDALDGRADAPELGETPSPADESLEARLSSERLSTADETFDTGGENFYADEAAADRMNAVADAPMADGPGGEQALDASAWSTVGRGGAAGFDDGDFGLEGRCTAEISLREHLHQQIGLRRTAPQTALIAGELVELLDDAGYLTADLDGVAARLGASAEQVADALTLLQSLEPTGVGARSLRECLSLQLRERNRLDPAMSALLDNLDLLARHDLAKLQKACGVDLEDLREMVHEIRALDPRPATLFASDIAQTLIPDVFVFENAQGGWSIELNAETLPKLLINASYAAEVTRSGGDGPRGDAVREYVAEHHQAASWLLKSIDQRAKTILRVATEIVRQQDGFFAYGVSGLKPLNLKRVADAIDMHESTVSRVTSNKYVSTPRGVFELKYFFTPAIQSTTGGEAYSAAAIRHRIKALIDSEPPMDVLSDDRIVTILRDAGVDIARRTVAKYREAMNIPSSLQRKREKSAVTVL